MNANMLSFDEAYEKLLGFVRPVREIEQVDTMFAAGRVLAVAQHSTINQPPMDNSGMDGYALRAANVPAAGIDTRGLKSPAALLQVLPAAATTTATPAAAPAAHVHAH